MTTRKALSWSAFWIMCAIVFGYGVYDRMGVEAMATFANCYVIEKLLSFDNLLMFYVIFRYFKLNAATQAKALYVGVASAFILRALLIFSGTNLIQHYHWLTYGFGTFLVWSSYKLLTSTEDGKPEAPQSTINTLFRWLPAGVTTFWLCIATIEVTDVLFALDSIPAAFGVTAEPFYIYTANIFAILGLRSMYFVLLNLIDRFHYMPVAIAGILAFIGGKMIIGINMPQLTTLTLVAGTLAVAAVLSWVKDITTTTE